MRTAEGGTLDGPEGWFRWHPAWGWGIGVGPDGQPLQGWCTCETTYSPLARFPQVPSLMWNFFRSSRQTNHSLNFSKSISGVHIKYVKYISICTRYIYIYLQKPQLGTRPFRGFYPPVKLKNESSVSKQSCPPVANVQTSSCQTRWSSIFLSFLLCSSNTSVGRSEDPLVAAL